MELYLVMKLFCIVFLATVTLCASRLALTGKHSLTAEECWEIQKKLHHLKQIKTATEMKRIRHRMTKSRCRIKMWPLMAPRIHKVKAFEQHVQLLHCCSKATRDRCRVLCSKLFAFYDQPENSIRVSQDFFTDCIISKAEPDLQDCVLEANSPCRLGCSINELEFCRPFVDPITTPYRTCSFAADTEARHLYQRWTKSGRPYPHIVASPSVLCPKESWKKLACVIALKPCDQHTLSNGISFNSCLEFVQRCSATSVDPLGVCSSGLEHVHRNTSASAGVPLFSSSPSLPHSRHIHAISLHAFPCFGKCQSEHQICDVNAVFNLKMASNDSYICRKACVHGRPSSLSYELFKVPKIMTGRSLLISNSSIWGSISQTSCSCNNNFGRATFRCDASGSAHTLMDWESQTLCQSAPLITGPALVALQPDWFSWQEVHLLEAFRSHLTVPVCEVLISVVRTNHSHVWVVVRLQPLHYYRALSAPNMWRSWTDYDIEIISRICYVELERWSILIEKDSVEFGTDPSLADLKCTRFVPQMDKLTAGCGLLYIKKSILGLLFVILSIIL